MQQAERLGHGQCVVVPYNVIYECAKSNLDSLLFDHVRSEDITQVVKIVNDTWDGFSLEKVFSEGMENVFRLCKQ